MWTVCVSLNNHLCWSGNCVHLWGVSGGGGVGGAEGSRRAVRVLLNIQNEKTFLPLAMSDSDNRRFPGNQNLWTFRLLVLNSHFVLPFLESIPHRRQWIVRLLESIENKWKRREVSAGTCGGRGSLLLSHACLWVALVNIKKENTGWKSQNYLRAALGVILVAGSHSRHRRMKSVNRGSSQPDICILWQLIVDLCLALEGKDDELSPPLRAVCSSLDPGGPLGLPRRDLMEYTELRKQYWTIQRIRQRPSIVRMVD